MATNPQAEGQTRISLQISEEEKEQLTRLAKESNMTLSAYVRQVLIEAIDSDTTYARHKTRSPQPPLSIVEPIERGEDVDTMEEAKQHFLGATPLRRYRDSTAQTPHPKSSKKPPSSP